MKKIILSLSILGSLLFAGYNENAGGIPEDIIKEFKTLPANEITKLMAQELKDSLPMKIDKSTQLISVISNDNNLIYIKTIDVSRDKRIGEFISNSEKKEELFKHMYEMEKNYICSDEMSSFLLKDKKIVFGFKYLDKSNKKQLKEYSVSAKDCQ